MKNKFNKRQAKLYEDDKTLSNDIKETLNKQNSNFSKQFYSQADSYSRTFCSAGAEE